MKHLTPLRDTQADNELDIALGLVGLPPILVDSPTGKKKKKKCKDKVTYTTRQDNPPSIVTPNITLTVFKRLAPIILVSLNL